MPHHWYPEGYIDPLTPPETPVWTNTFKSYCDPPLAPNGSNPLTTSGSTGQLLSSGTASRNPQNARVPVTGPGSGSASRFSPKVGSQGKAVHSTAMPVPPGSYHMGVAPAQQRLPRLDSIRGSSTGHRSVSVNTEAIFEQPQWDGASEFINGSTYFKIGEPVYVRRWFTDDKVHSAWLLGKVVRPDFCKDREGREERRYVVSYWDPRTETEKEKTYSPSLKEIIPVDIDMPTSMAIPVARSVSSATAGKQTSSHGNSTVFALLPNTSGSEPCSVWTPAVCLGVDPVGYRVRVIAGPSKNQEFSNVLEIMAYNAETARTLRISGHNVERSAFDGRH